MQSSYKQLQNQIAFVKTYFSQQLSNQLNLIEVQAPILSRIGDGIQDNLSGHEKAVQVNIKSIANAKSTVMQIYTAIKQTELIVSEKYGLKSFLPENIQFIDSESLLKRYPNLSAKERENAIAKELGAVFIIGIGGVLSNNQKHDVRAPDYDDWSTKNEEGHYGLNGDIVVWNPILNSAFEISSMGIRVDAKALQKQLQNTNDEDRLNLPWHQALINGTLLPTIGGGIGQSRLVMLLLQCKHIGQVQSSVWDVQTIQNYSDLL